MESIKAYTVCGTRKRAEAMMRIKAKELIDRDICFVRDGSHIVTEKYEYSFVSMYQVLHYGDAMMIDKWSLDWTCSNFQVKKLCRAIEILRQSQLIAGPLK